MASARSNIDGVRMAVLTARFNGIARKMANTLFRTGRSGILTIAHDFSCAVLTADHELLAAAESLPIHVLRGPEIMTKTMTDNHPSLKRGDAFLHNSPYHGCTHPADHSILVPVIDDAGVHRFTVMAKGHQADCGNALPTTYMGAAKDVYAEGALIFPAVKIQDNYEHVMDIVRMCRLRMRVPDQWWGDYLATLGAARVGEREILALGDEVGWDLLAAYTKEWFDYSERRMIDIVRAMPKGTVTRTSTARPLSGNAGRRSHHKGDCRGEAGRGDDRSRSPRQSGQHGEWAEPLRGLRAFGAHGGDLQFHRPHRSEE